MTSRRTFLRVAGVGGMAVLGVAGCEGEVNGALGTGNWGGTGVTMVVSSAGTSFEFDCAHGFVDDRLATRGSRFSMEGRYVREHGGPDAEGSEEEPVAAFFEGEIRGATMSLYVRPLDTNEPIGPYLLERGSQGLIRKCL
jgi:hypothetical protein